MNVRALLLAAPFALALTACSSAPSIATSNGKPPTRFQAAAPESSRSQPSTTGVDVPVPATCTTAVNQKLETMIQANSRNYTENVMACGIAQKTTVNHGGEHGSHHIISVVVTLPTLGQKLIQIAINDSLDGPISARPGQSVFAFGQGYIDSGPWAAGIHDVHCSTHPTADNGWVVVNGVKTPSTCPSR